MTTLEQELQVAVEDLIRSTTGRPSRVRHLHPMSGGCINEARLLELADGRRFFVKSNVCPPADFFMREAEGLEALARSGTIRVPRPLGSGTDGSARPFLVLEAIATGRPRNGFFAELGRRFAELHRTPAPCGPNGEAFGFSSDNYLGSTPQHNTWCTDGCEFWRRHRLGAQLDLARSRGRSDPELDRLGDRVLDRLDIWLGDIDEPASLLHGDLWSGNYLVDEEGRPVLIDPAVSCGYREADLAMTSLFGGFDPSFYDAYREAWPLPPGSEERLELFQLYHLLNHLNLFGSSYRRSCLAILGRLA